MVFGDFLEDILGHLEHRQSIQLRGADPDRLQTMLLGMLAKRTKTRVVVCSAGHKDLQSWQRFAHSLNSEWQIDTARLPSTGLWGRDRFANQASIRAQRLYALSRFMRPSGAIIFTTMAGLLQKTLAVEEYSRLTLGLEVGREYDQDDLLATLRERGYFAANTAQEEGAMALRGGILDVFPSNERDPLRFEFFGDELQSIRSFSAETQRSLASQQSAEIFSAQEVDTPSQSRREQSQIIYEFLLRSEMDQADREGINHAFLNGHRFQGFDTLAPLLRAKQQSAIDFLNSDDIIVFPQSIESCFASYQEFLLQAAESYEKDNSAGRPVLPPSRHYVDGDDTSILGEGPFIEANNPIASPGSYQLSFPFGIDAKVPQHNAKGAERFQAWLDILGRYRDQDYRIMLLAEHEDQRKRIRQLLDHRDMDCLDLPEAWREFLAEDRLPDSMLVSRGYLEGYLLFERERLLVVSERALFGQSKAKPKPPSRKLQNYLSSFKELKIGGLVVHVDHGIGRYLGLKNIEVAGNRSDYLVLEYYGGDKIYLPVDRLSLLQRYSTGAGQDQGQRVDRLQSQSWTKRKSKVRKAVQDMAADLLKAHAQRKLAPGILYTPLGESYYQFESEFPYAETEDQNRAIQDVQADMGSQAAMDRLICGDVGFGKTEVALRAAYRAVLDGYQVLVLVPTTVLCYQHFRTFQDRLGKYGVRVAQMNRFVARLDSIETIKALESGRVDVLIGTHRLLSKDIQPKRLGLLVVDEEQRFGVTHKEKLKKLRAGCDILTLTATPIPRTLHMSMLGMRDISIIATPPQQRLSVKTYVAQFDENLIREAITQEVERGGQVFFLHNRVEDIEHVCGMLRSLLPDVAIRFAHGQMSEQRLEQVIVDFLEQKFSVLVCTTIIESGIDMPAVNTLIVNDSQRFGLAQLYQIRGRVGRSSRQAYAYFLTPTEERLNDEAKRRLDVLTTYQDLGSGFQIASHDLEIRGAGNLLGAEQSGRVSDVGLELYTQLLDQAIQEIKGQPVAASHDAELKLPVSAAIPFSYVSDETQRLHLYKQMFSEDSAEGLRDLRADITDRFGKMAEEMQLLFAVAELKRLLRKLGATQIAATKFGEIELRFGSLQEAQIDKMLSVVSEKPKRYRLSPDYRLHIGGIEAPIGSAVGQLNYVESLCAAIQPLVFVVAN